MKSAIFLIFVFTSLMANLSFGELVPPYRTSSFGILSSVTQEEYSTYKDSILTIPRVDTNEQVGMFQDARFVFSEGSWKLIDFKTTDTMPRLFQPYISQVKPIIIDSFPVQVFLRVTGYNVDKCDFFYSINKIPRLKAIQRLVANRFEVTIYQNGYQDGTDNLPVSYIERCTREPSSANRFETIIPLSTYGLRAGTYQYVVSRPNRPDPFYDIATGSFELKKDNLLPAEDIPDPLDDA